MDQLKLAGFDMTKLSINGKDYHTEENVIGYYNAGGRMSPFTEFGAQATHNQQPHARALVEVGRTRRLIARQANR
jgi:hypothetical protein